MPAMIGACLAMEGTRRAKDAGGCTEAACAYNRSASVAFNFLTTQSAYFCSKCALLREDCMLQPDPFGFINAQVCQPFLKRYKLWEPSFSGDQTMQMTLFKIKITKFHIFYIFVLIFMFLYRYRPNSISRTVASTDSIDGTFATCQRQIIMKLETFQICDLVLYIFYILFTGIHALPVCGSVSCELWKQLPEHSLRRDSIDGSVQIRG